MDDLTPAQCDTLERFADAVAASRHNLVSSRARSELMTRHVPESVTFAQRLPAGPARVLDIGSGGGFPGLVVAIVRPDLQVELLDSTQKKTAFLVETAAALEVEVAVHTGRAEELGRGPLRGLFDHVTARAVAPLDRLVGLAVPFLRPGGILHAIKGEQWAAEVAAAQSVLTRLHARVVATPDGDTARPGTSPRVVSIART